jgi:hypothetical protein
MKTKTRAEPKTRAELFEAGALSMSRLLRAGEAGGMGDLRLRSRHRADADDDTDTTDLVNDDSDDDDEDNDDDGGLLVATFGTSHFSKRSKAGKLQVWSKK